ncbi:MAG: hypothetical protein R3B47_16440 [Bacteroidia bacterium]
MIQSANLRGTLSLAERHCPSAAMRAPSSLPSRSTTCDSGLSNSLRGEQK